MTSIPRVDRRTLRYDAAASVGGKSVPLTVIRFTVLPVGVKPVRSTPWMVAPIVDGVAEVVFAGPEAPDDVVANFELALGDYLVWFQLPNGDDTITGSCDRLSVD